jgi:hypothetical protein
MNNFTTDFAVEELEPRVEMQMLGLGFDPSTVRDSNGKIVAVIIETDAEGNITEVY